MISVSNFFKQKGFLKNRFIPIKRRNNFNSFINRDNENIFVNSTEIFSQPFFHYRGEMYSLFSIFLRITGYVIILCVPALYLVIDFFSVISKMFCTLFIFFSKSIYIFYLWFFFFFFFIMIFFYFIILFNFFFFFFKEYNIHIYSFFRYFYRNRGIIQGYVILFIYFLIPFLLLFFIFIIPDIPDIVVILHDHIYFDVFNSSFFDKYSTSLNFKNLFKEEFFVDLKEFLGYMNFPLFFFFNSIFKFIFLTTCFLKEITFLIYLFIYIFFFILLLVHVYISITHLFRFKTPSQKNTEDDIVAYVHHYFDFYLTFNVFNLNFFIVVFLQLCVNYSIFLCLL